jgi:hypothetical protein
MKSLNDDFNSPLIDIERDWLRIPCILIVFPSVLIGTTILCVCAGIIYSIHGILVDFLGRGLVGPDRMGDN